MAKSAIIQLIRLKMAGKKRLFILVFVPTWCKDISRQNKGKGGDNECALEKYRRQE